LSARNVLLGILDKKKIESHYASAHCCATFAAGPRSAALF
jgi:hypothetical protein